MGIVFMIFSTVMVDGTVVMAQMKRIVVSYACKSPNYGTMDSNDITRVLI